jgi:hypothetical protein
MEPTITTNPSAIASAFDEWLRRYEENPDDYYADYRDGEEETYGEACARLLIELLGRPVSPPERPRPVTENPSKVTG